MSGKDPAVPLELSLLELPQREARGLLATGVPVYLFVNPVEFHGPHLSLRSDGVLARAVARDVHVELFGGQEDRSFVVGGVIDAGVDTTRGAGSQPVKMGVVGALVERACAGLADLGARAVVSG